MKLTIDTAAATLTREENGSVTTRGLFTKEAFEAVSHEWLRMGYSLAYYHSFSWFGLPILQLPEDLVRMQELIYRVRPRWIIETGVFQGGSMLFYASLMQSLGEGRVIGIDLQIPDFVRRNVESHFLAPRISLIEGSSTDAATMQRVKELIGDEGPVMIMLDSDHSRNHVRDEMELYSPLVTKGSYLIVADGYMKDIWNVPRALPEWKTDNPWEAAQEFAKHHPEFLHAQPEWTCTAGMLTENITYFPGGWFRRL